MMVKTLAEMTVPELESEVAAAREEYAMADYIDGISAWRIARDAAWSRMHAAETALTARKAGEKNDGL